MHDRSGVLDLITPRMCLQSWQSPGHRPISNGSSVAVKLSSRLHVAAQVNGKVFYIDADHFGDAHLLALLSPADPDQPPSQQQQQQPSVAKLGGARR